MNDPIFARCSARPLIAHSGVATQVGCILLTRDLSVTSRGVVVQVDAPGDRARAVPDRHDTGGDAPIVPGEQIRHFVSLDDDVTTIVDEVAIRLLPGAVHRFRED